MSKEHKHEVDFKTAFKVEELGGSQVKISGELPWVELQSERTAAIVALGKDVKIDGFRKGNVFGRGGSCKERQKQRTGEQSVSPSSHGRGVMIHHGNGPVFGYLA